MSAPLCAVCFRSHRAEGSAKCLQCAPGEVAVPAPLRSAPLTRFERAVLMLDAEDRKSVV